jgi:hypothetical protein
VFFLNSIPLKLFAQDEKYGLVSTQTDARRCSPVLGNFVDVDLPEVAGKKCMSIRRSKLLLGRIAGDNESDVKVSRTDLHSSDYHIVAADFTDTAAFEAKLTTDCGLVSFFCLKYQLNATSKKFFLPLYIFVHTFNTTFTKQLSSTEFLLESRKLLLFCV